MHINTFILEKLCLETRWAQAKKLKKAWAWFNILELLHKQICIYIHMYV